MAKRKHKRDGKNPVFACTNKATAQKNTFAEIKAAFAQTLSNTWVQYFVRAFVVSTIALVAALVTSTGVKAAAVTFASLGTVALWLFAVLAIRHVSSETEYHGVLLPADKPMPDNPCGEIPANALAIFLGRSAAYSSASLHTVLRIHGEDVLSFKRVNGKIAINARVFSRDGRIVAEIRDNEFFINPNNYFRRERPDAHSLTVFDQENRRVLEAFYLNPRAVRFSGIFSYPQREVVISDGSGLFRNTICFGENGTDVEIN